MTICPIAITAGCKKCLVYPVCPVKGLIGDQKPAEKTAGGRKDKEKN